MAVIATVKHCAYDEFTSGMEVDGMDMEEKVKGAHLRGQKYTVSQDGLCPRCGNSNRLYVILDKLFPMGDMPEILHSLIAKGRAILWSSQEKDGFKDPPTFLCRGFCPPDPLGAGFNVDWNRVSVNQILESLDNPIQKATVPVPSPNRNNIQGGNFTQDESLDNQFIVLDNFNDSEVQRNTLQESGEQSGFNNGDEEGDDEDVHDDYDDDELDEEELIKQMLAKEQQKLSQENSDEDNNDKEDKNASDDDKAQAVCSDSEDSPEFSKQNSLTSDSVNPKVMTMTASTKHTPSTTSSNRAKTPESQYPVSSSGRCPYCGSTDVKYIIVVSDNTHDTKLPPSLQMLLKGNHAFKMAKGESEPPSFQCQKCQYGFNLDWSKTNLEMIFGLPPSTSSATSVTVSYKPTTSAAYQTPYRLPAAHPPYPQASVPPPGYHMPVGVPPQQVPPLPFHGGPPTYPGYYGPYHPPPPIPPPVGSYYRYPSSTVPSSAIPYAGVPPPGVFPPTVPPPGMPPPAVLAPRVPPPRMPPPGMMMPGLSPPVVPPDRLPPHRLPPPVVYPPGYPPTIATSTPPARDAYPQPHSTYNPMTPPYQPPPVRSYLPTPGARPNHPLKQQPIPQRPGKLHPWNQVAVTTVATVPQQQALAVQQAEEGDLGKIAATRFEIVLNQIDNAKARVRHEKQQLQQFQRVVEQEQNSAEPNALTEEGMKVPEYDEKPPGDDDQELDLSIIIAEDSEEDKRQDSLSSMTTSAQSVLPSQKTFSDHDVSVQPNANTQAVSYDTAVDELKEGAVTETPESASEKEVSPKGGQTGQSVKQEVSMSPSSPPFKPVIRRSRRSGHAAISEDTDSSATEEETTTVRGRQRRARRTKPPSREVEMLDITDNNANGGKLAEVETSEVEVEESSDVQSQSSVIPRTESDSTHEVPSESLISSSETEAAEGDGTRPARGKTTQGRKRKTEAAAIATPPIRKSRRRTAEQQLGSQDQKESEDEEMLVIDNNAASSCSGETRLPSSEVRCTAFVVGDLSNSEELSVQGVNVADDRNVAAEKMDTKEHSLCQTRKSTPQLQVSTKETESNQQNSSTLVSEEMQRYEAVDANKTRKSIPKRVLSTSTETGAKTRRTRNSEQLSTQEPELLSGDLLQKSDQEEDNETVNSQEHEEMTDASVGEQEKNSGRRTRKNRKLPFSSKIRTPEYTTSASEEDKPTPIDSRKSSTSNEDTTSEDVELSVMSSDTSEVGVSPRRTRRNKVKPGIEDNSELSQGSDNSVTNIFEEKASTTRRGRVARNKTPIVTPDILTKRVTRARKTKEL
ncbi:uncharacterized protein LOC141890216 isoform X4 [Acropora palmata]|uniref:uncharacterized protein LOC141890216 isoform X4 n=1 Tax=Acropora palmata TaxID=6131 RepID=UPI003DA0E6FD